MTILSNTLALIVVLSVLVVAHEFGHFAVAKWFRFPVEVFSVGFGKRLFGKKWRGTDYRVSAIPLGGYVRVIGLGPDESTVTEGTSQEAPPVGKRWQRALVLLAGPTMNILLALGLHTAVFVIGVEVPGYELAPAVIGYVEPGSAAAQAGLHAGDRFVTINGTHTPRWRDAQYILGDERAREARGRGRPRRQGDLHQLHAETDGQVRHRRRGRLPGVRQGPARPHRHGRRRRRGRGRRIEAGRRHPLGGRARHPGRPDRDAGPVHRRRPGERAGPVPDRVRARRQDRHGVGPAEEGRRHLARRRQGRPGSARGARALPDQGRPWSRAGAGWRRTSA